jgi:hypothetical protein
LHGCANLKLAIGVQQQGNALTGTDTMVMGTLRANFRVIFQVFFIQDGLAGWAFTPQTLWHGFFIAADHPFNLLR